MHSTKITELQISHSLRNQASSNYLIKSFSVSQIKDLIRSLSGYPREIWVPTSMIREMQPTSRLSWSEGICWVERTWCNFIDLLWRSLRFPRTIRFMLKLWSTETSIRLSLGSLPILQEINPCLNRCPKCLRFTTLKVHLFRTLPNLENRQTTLIPWNNNSRQPNTRKLVKTKAVLHNRSRIKTGFTLQPRAKRILRLHQKMGVLRDSKFNRDQLQVAKLVESMGPE